jgi:hypothetical protein
MKRCFTCKKNKPLILFGTNKRKYQISSDKGKLINCRLCETKKFIRNKGNIVKFNYKTNRFDIVKKGLSIINVIKRYLNYE